MIFIAVKYEMLFNSCELTFVFQAGKFPSKTFEFRTYQRWWKYKDPTQNLERPCYAQLTIVIYT